ncbi:NINE protein [Yoonia sp.]|uniref:NINE protein n=1 Tax=Yoonia sp. TaxID=2212373 RepID=UPI00391BFF59
MDTQQQILLEQRVANGKKSLGVAYLLLFFLGGFGAHRFYLGRMGTGFAILFLVWGGVLLSAILIGIPMLIIGGIWVLVDIFLLPSMVELDTQRLRATAAQEINAMALTQRS